MPFRFNPFTQKPDIVDVVAIPPGTVTALDGDSGGAVGPDVSGDIFVVGGNDISTTGNPGTNTLTLDYTGDPIDFLAGDSGGNIGPDGSGVVSVIGSGDISVSGSGNTLTISDSSNIGITPFVVGTTGNFATIQSAIDAASAGNTVYIQSSNSAYSEDLTLKAGVHLCGLTPSNGSVGVVISGQHALPTSGTSTYSNIIWGATTTSIFDGGSSGSPALQFFNSVFSLSTTTVFSLTSLTPTIRISECYAIGTGGALFSTVGGSVSIYNSDLGSGSATENFTSTTVNILNSRINSSILCTNGTFFSSNNRLFRYSSSGSATTSIVSTSIDPSGNPCVTHNSTGSISIFSCALRTIGPATEVIAGTGTGLLSIAGLSFLAVQTISPSLTVSTGPSTYATNLFLGGTTSSYFISGSGTAFSASFEATNTSVGTSGICNINFRTNTSRQAGLFLQDIGGVSTQYFLGRSYVGGGANTGLDILQANSVQAASFTSNANTSIGNRLEPSATCLLSATSTTKAFAPPRMDTTQKNAIVSLVAGMQIYDTSLNVPAFYNGTVWKDIIFDSGTYTPTMTNVSNTVPGSSTINTHHFMRIGNEVTVTGDLQAALTGSVSTAAFTLSLPIASNMTAATDLRGTGQCFDSTSAVNRSPIFIIGETTADTAQITVSGMNSATAASLIITYEFKYIVK